MQDIVKEIYTESIQAHIAAGEVLPSPLESAAFTIAQNLINGNKLICCGYQSCQMLAQHIATILVNCYETERPCLPAIALNTEVNNLSTYAEQNEHEVFSRQVRAFAQQGDMLLAIAVNGNEKSIISAVESALTKDMTVIVLVGNDGGELSGLLGPNDVEIRVPSKRPSRIIESHLLSLHCLSELIDLTLFPQDEIHA
ncbi:DnaA initiator-associating protein DiaA [Pseudoalteromonas sp. NBT06-2]|uniref:SIS domain-containing protein n=1 Tax=Pseudoalteromonas sp. NBT06-2 TaxID=2025950 RepID=UPI000BA7D87C|nr:SIS domain-containing protein [Pseudoalteromonas sp. NBT06-2]PAJ72512.1 DnaA initiator-associating protein DiaA [Pseudoalteromonas sp. NBT06-2]